MNTMTIRPGSVAGVVKGLNGVATATDRNGNTRVLAEGGHVHADEVVQAQPGATVHIELTGGGFATVGGGDSLALAPGVLSDAALAAAEAEKTDVTAQAEAGDEATVQPLQEEIAQGKDPSVLEEPAGCCVATPDSVAQEGSGFVIVAQQAARGEVTPGFATAMAGGGLDEGSLVAHDEGIDYRLAAENGEPGHTPDPGDGGGPGITPEPGLPDVDGRFVMYMDGSALDDGTASYEMTGKAQGGLHTADASRPVSTANGYGMATIVDGLVVYTMSDAAREKLAAEGTLTDYVRYTDTDGTVHTIEVILTTDGSHAGTDVGSETHYSVDMTEGLHVSSGSGNDVHDYRAFSNSTLDTGAGSDSVTFSQAADEAVSVLYNSTVKTREGDDTLVVKGEGATQVIGVHDSSIHLGDGNNTLEISAVASKGEVRGAYGATITTGDGDQRVHITAEGQSSGNVYGMAKSELVLGEGQHTVDIDVVSNGTWALGLHSATIHSAGSADIHVSAQGAYVSGVQNSNMLVDGKGTVTIDAAGFGQVHGLYASTDGSSTIARSDGTAADVDVDITASSTRQINSPDAIAAYAGDVSIHITGEVNAWALAGTSGTASKSWTFNYGDPKYDGDAGITIKAGTVNLYAGYDNGGNTTRDLQAAYGVSTSVSSSLGHDASQVIAAHRPDGSGSITVKANGAGHASMATVGVSASAGSGNTAGTAQNTLTADDHITIRATSEGNSIRFPSNSAVLSHGAVGLSATTGNAGTGAMNLLKAAHVNIFAGLSEYRGTATGVNNIREASAAAVVSKAATPGSTFNRITADDVSIRAQVTSEKSDAAFTQKAYGLTSEGYGSNQVFLTGTGTSTIGAYAFATAGHDGLNQQMVYAMHAAGAGAENLVHGGIPGEMAGGTVVLEAMADSANSKAWGMAAMDGGSNALAAAAVEIHTDGDYQYGMAAAGGSNTVTADDFIHTVTGEPAIDHRWSMHATDGGTNHIGTADGSTADVRYELEGGMYAESGSMNTIITGDGDDTIRIHDHVIGERVTDSAYDYTNWISTGDGSDTVVFFSYTSGVGVDLGAGDDHLVLYGGTDNLVNASFNGGDGWDIVHISGDYSLAAVMGAGGNGNVFTGFEAFDMGGNDTSDVLTIDSILSGFGSLASTDGFSESEGAGLLDRLSGGDASVLFVNGDSSSGTLGIGDLVDFGGSGNWGALGGSVSHGGSDYVVYHNALTNEYVAIEDGVSVIGF